MTDTADGRWHPIEEKPSGRFGYDESVLVAPGYGNHHSDPAKCDGDSWFTVDGHEHKLDPRWFYLVPLPPG